MKRFASVILATLVGSVSVLAVSQNADASPYEWHEWHDHYDRGYDRDHWRDARWREREEWRERRERREREERRREWWWREHHGWH